MKPNVIGMLVVAMLLLFMLVQCSGRPIRDALGDPIRVTTALPCQNVTQTVAIVSERYDNGSTRTLTGKLVCWDYSARSMTVQFKADGIAVSSFEAKP